MGIKKVTSLQLGAIWSHVERTLDILLPPHSLLTGLQIDKTISGAKDGFDQSAELELWQNIKFLDAPCCELCGFPFEFDQGDDALCGQCIAYPPKYDKGRSAITYDEYSRKLVLDFKHGGRTDGLDFFVRQMSRAGRKLIAEAEIIIPVPLHNARLRQRKFNQSALLARRLSQTSGLPYNCDILRRRKNTPSQGTRTFAQRRKNMAGAFYISPRHKPRLLDANILLVDDVLTSGATVNACTQVLKRAKAKQVNVLTLMRVARPSNIPK